MSGIQEGGCACGAVRYRVREAFDVVYCHCTKCRRRSGAPVSLSVVVPKSAFELVSGAPASFSNSDAGASHFCATCGTPLYFIEKHGPYVSVSHGSLDAPEDVRPRAHQWTDRSPSWFRIDDELPAFTDGQLTHPDQRPNQRR